MKDFEKLSLKEQAEHVLKCLQLPLYVGSIPCDVSDVLEEICIGSCIHVVKTNGDSKEMPFMYVVTRQFGSRDRCDQELECSHRVLDALAKAIVEATSDYVDVMLLNYNETLVPR